MTDLIRMGKKAVTAKYELQNLSTELKNKVLADAANILLEDTTYLLLTLAFT